MSNGEAFGLIKLKVPDTSLEEKTRAIVIPREDILEAARCLAGQGFDSLHNLTAVDNKDDVTLVYHFYSMKKRTGIVLKTRLLPDDLTVESVERFWRSADWLEREVYDLFGIKFLNHPNLKRILNPEEWTIHPLRKT